MSGSNIIKFYPPNAAESPDAVLEQAIGVYENVLIIGWDKDGYLDVRSEIGSSNRDVLWLVELFKAKLMKGDYAPDDQ